MSKTKEALEDEKERHKAMVLYLMNERKQLLTKLAEEKRKILPGT